MGKFTENFQKQQKSVDWKNSCSGGGGWVGLG
jgi:hypothetical protein